MRENAMTSIHEPVHGLHARIIGRVTLDEPRLAADLRALDQLPFNRGYSDYARGNPGWQNTVLMNHTGNPGDQTFGGHDGPALATPHLDSLPYVAELLQATFAPEHLLWARIFMCEDGMLIPHRDYLDLPEDEFTRVHIPLQLGTASLHSEMEHVFRMRKGEVWFIDGTVNHAAYSYDGAPRVYLSCDFRSGVAFDDLFLDRSLVASDVVPDFVDLPPLPDDFDRSLDRWAEAIRTNNERGESVADTFDRIVGELSKVHFNHRAPCGQIYEWLIDVATRAEHPGLVDRAKEKRAFFLGV